jgi:hypothetical protein
MYLRDTATFHSSVKVLTASYGEFPMRLVQIRPAQNFPDFFFLPFRTLSVLDLSPSQSSDDTDY